MMNAPKNKPRVADLDSLESMRHERADPSGDSRVMVVFDGISSATSVQVGAEEGAGKPAQERRIGHVAEPMC